MIKQYETNGDSKSAKGDGSQRHVQKHEFKY
jgi:hypothetical protein